MAIPLNSTLFAQYCDLAVIIINLLYNIIVSIIWYNVDHLKSCQPVCIRIITGNLVNPIGQF